MYDGELQDFYCSLDIIRVVTSRRLGWVEHVACSGEKM
jgi:hypothetical protein